MSKILLSSPLEFLPSGERLLTPEEVCQWLRISQRTLDRYVADGEIRPIKIRRLNRYPVLEIEAFIARWNQKGLPRHVNGTPILPGPTNEVDDDSWMEGA